MRPIAYNGRKYPFYDAEARKVASCSSPVLEFWSLLLLRPCCLIVWLRGSLYLGTQAALVSKPESLWPYAPGALSVGNCGPGVPRA